MARRVASPLPLVCSCSSNQVKSRWEFRRWVALCAHKREERVRTRTRGRVPPWDKNGSIGRASEEDVKEKEGVVKQGASCCCAVIYP